MKYLSRSSLLSVAAFSAILLAGIGGAQAQSELCIVGSTPQERILGCTMALSEDIDEEMRSDVLAIRAASALQIGELSAARSDLDSFIASAPGDDRGWMLLGQLDAEEGELFSALSAFSTAIDLNADNNEARMGRATMFYTLDQADRCVADVDRVLIAGSESLQAGAVGLRGLCRLELDDVFGAIHDLEKSVELGSSAGRLAALSSAYLAADKKAEAYVTAEKAVAADKGSLTAIDALFVAMEAAGRGDEALERLIGFLKANPDDAGFANMLSWRQYLAGQSENALKTIAPFVDEEDAAIQDTVAHIALALEDPKAALSAFAKALEIGGVMQAEEYRQFLKVQGYNQLDSSQASILQAIEKCLDEKGAGCKLYDGAEAGAVLSEEDKSSSTDDDAAEEDSSSADVQRPSRDMYFLPL